MPTVNIEDKGCRGCTLCVDICPADVFEFEEQTELAKVPRPDDCIGCYSCFYYCPSQCIEIGDTHVQRPFYRIEQNVAFVEKFLQAETTSASLTAEDWEEARKDVSSTLTALAEAIIEMMGRGTVALGRKSGSAAAAHMPEMYEETDLDGILRGLQRNFGSAFPFDFQTSGEEIAFTFKPCGLVKVVEEAGQQVGKAVLCDLFHNYLAGLVGAYNGVNYKFDVPRAGESCELRMTAKNKG